MIMCSNFFVKEGPTLKLYPIVQNLVQLSFLCNQGCRYHGFSGHFLKNCNKVHFKKLKSLQDPCGSEDFGSVFWVYGMLEQRAYCVEWLDQ